MKDVSQNVLRITSKDPPFATSPLDPSIALSLVLPPSASLPPHPSTPRHLAPSTSRPPRPHSHHRSRTLPARRPLHSRPLTYPQGGNRTNDHSRTTPHNRQRNKPLRLDICVCVSIILPSKCLPRRTDVVSHTRSSKGREQKKNMVQDSAIRSSSENGDSHNNYKMIAGRNCTGIYSTTYMFYFGEPTIVSLRDRGKSKIKR